MMQLEYFKFVNTNIRRISYTFIVQVSRFDSEIRVIQQKKLSPSAKMLITRPIMLLEISNRYLVYLCSAL